MGIVAMLTRVQESVLDKYIMNPALLNNFINSETREIDDDRELYLDKSWDGVHYLVNGVGIDQREKGKVKIDPPLCWFLFSMQKILYDEDEYEAHYARPSQVLELTTRLLEIDRDQLQEKFNPKLMNTQRVYSNQWGTERKEEELNYLLSYFELIKAFYVEAANNNEAIFIYIGF